MITAAALLVIAGILGGGYAARHFYISHNGITLKAKQDMKPLLTSCYQQNDPLWGSERIGRTSTTIGSQGCLISCAAASITNLGYQITPKELNHKLTAKDGYDGANLIWYKIHEAIPEMDYKYSRIFTASTIDRDLKNGYCPLVNVKFRNGGITHWVMIVGAENGEYLVCDPLNPDAEPFPLSEHGKVYSYRVIVPAEEQ